MSIDSIGQLSNSFPYISKTHIRFVVNDKVKTQVINSYNGKVIREIPRTLSPNILEILYA